MTVRALSPCREENPAEEAFQNAFEGYLGAYFEGFKHFRDVYYLHVLNALKSVLILLKHVTHTLPGQAWSGHRARRISIKHGDAPPLGARVPTPTTWLLGRALF